VLKLPSLHVGYFNTVRVAMLNIKNALNQSINQAGLLH